MKIDLMEHPVVIELYSKDSDEFISAQFAGSERKKLDGCTLEKAVKMALDNFTDDKATAKDTKKEIENTILDCSNHSFEIYGHKINVELDDAGNELVDHRKDLFNNSDYLKELKTDSGKPYLGSEIHVWDDDGGKLGYK